MTNYIFNIGTRRGNCCYDNTCVRDIRCFYTSEEQEILLSGGEVASEWDEDENPVAWDYICEEEEEEEEC